MGTDLLRCGCAHSRGLREGGQATLLAQTRATAVAEAFAASQARADAQATAAVQATGAAQATAIAAKPVRICTQQHYSGPDAVCKQSDSGIGPNDWSSSQLSFCTLGSNFTSTRTHFAVSQTNSDGSLSVLGVDDITSTSLDVGTESVDLASVFDSAGVIPTDGATYQVEVDDGSILLGTAEFTNSIQPTNSVQPVV
jgi:hypothetical protein